MLQGIELDLDWGTLLSTAGGGGLAIAVCKALIAKALRDFEGVIKKINEIIVSLSAINVKLNEIDKLHSLIMAHDRAIQRLEAKFEHEYQSRLFKNSPIGISDSENRS